MFSPTGVFLSDLPPCELLLVRIVGFVNMLHIICLGARSARNAVVQVVLLAMARALARVEVIEGVGWRHASSHFISAVSLWPCAVHRV